MVVGVERRMHEAHPEVCDLQEPMAVILRAGQAARFGGPKRQGPLSTTSTKSAQERTEHNQKNLYLHLRPAPLA